MPNAFILITHRTVSEGFVEHQLRAIIATDTIDSISETPDDGFFYLTQKDGTRWQLVTPIDDIWNQLKPNIIFA